MTRFPIAGLVGFLLQPLTLGAVPCTDYSAYPRLVGRADGIGVVRDVTLAGRHAIVVTEEDRQARLGVVDVSDRDRPRPIAFADVERSGRVEVANGHAFVTARYAGVQIVDVSVPERPTVVGSIPTTDHSSDVAVRGDLLFVADWTGFAIVDVTDPATPVALAFVPEAETQRVAVSGDHLYTASTSLKSWDVSDPTAPVFLDDAGRCRCFWEGDCCGYADLEVANGIAYVLETSQHCLDPVDCFRLGVVYDSRLEIWDVTDPAHVVFAGSLGLAGGLNDPDRVTEICVLGGRAYASGTDGLLRVVDVAEPARPRVINHVPTGSSGGLAASADGSSVTVFVAESGLGVYDVTNAEYPSFAGDPACDGIPIVRDIAVGGGTAYVAGIECPQGTSPGAVIRGYAAEPPWNLLFAVTSPSYGYFGTVEGKGGDLEIAGGDLYLSGGSLGRADVAEPGSAPGSFQGVPGVFIASDTEPVGDYLLVAERGSGLAVLATPLDAEPVLVNRLPERPVRAVSADGPLAVALGGAWSRPSEEGRIHTLDVSDPARPAFLGTLAGVGRHDWVALRGHLAAAGGETLVLVDVSVPAAPVELAALPLPHGSLRGEFAGSLLYVATERGFHSIDVRDPTNPRIRGRVPTDPGRGFHLLDGTVLCAEGGRFSVLPRDCAPFTHEVGVAPEPPVRSLVAWPNPFRTETSIVFRGAAPGRLPLEVFDARGRRVRSLVASGGTQAVRWNGRGDDGLPVAAGVYFVRLRLGPATVTHKVTYLR